MPLLSRSLLVDLAIVLVMALVAVAGYRYSPLILPKADLTVAPEAGCDLNRAACAALLPDGGRVELAITPRPVPVVKPMRVAVRYSGLAVHQAEIDFAGATMNMGYNRLPLSAEGADGFGGEATIPVCVTGRMVWVATLLLETDRQRISIPFTFEAPLESP